MATSIGAAVSKRLRLEGRGNLVGGRSTGGGCINNAMIISTDKDEQFFLKQNSRAHADMFASEAQSLLLIRESDSLHAPQPFYWDADFLLMEVVIPGPKQSDYWEKFGAGLAAMHQSTSPSFGLDFGTYCGTTLQPNERLTDGYRFYAEKRLLMQGQLAEQNGFFSSADHAALESLCRRLPDIVPKQPASLIHGDLWSGNAHTNSIGEPVLIDPALYFGWREADLAMTKLFGGFPDRFYAAYNEAWPMETGWQERFVLYNLYHIINHLNLFGSGYLHQARSILRQYS